MDIKGPNLVKGIHFEGLRKLGDPNQFSRKYYEEGIDELIYIDIVASLYERNNLTEIVKKTTENIFIPITVGGGIRTLEDARELLRSGADKIAVNTAVLKKPELISEISNHFGSQCMVLSIQAKKIADGKWEAYYDCGRETTGIDVVQWAKKGYELGAGEILLTSVDQEGTQRGFDLELIREISSIVPIPVIASGGMGAISDFTDAVKNGKADALAVGSVLHYNKLTVTEIKKYALEEGINIRG